MAQQIKVQTPELALAAGAIGKLKSEIEGAQTAINSARGQVGAFGGDPVASAFSDMCGQASQAAAEFGETVSQLANNVAMASLGYVTTDEGVIPVSLLGPEAKNP